MVWDIHGAFWTISLGKGGMAVPSMHSLDTKELPRNYLLSHARTHTRTHTELSTLTCLSCSTVLISIISLWQRQYPNCSSQEFPKGHLFFNKHQCSGAPSACSFPKPEQLYWHLYSVPIKCPPLKDQLKPNFQFSIKSQTRQSWRRSPQALLSWCSSQG